MRFFLIYGALQIDLKVMLRTDTKQSAINMEHYEVLA